MTETGQWNAMRFAQNPLPQPSYNFANVPKACRDLTGSVLQHVDDRENLKVCMAEMLLLCKEAMRRRPGKGTGSKPLSLEYLADRLDIDDPCFGYLVRTNENTDTAAKDGWEKGMLQGFITVTTFTNWQKTFRWDSTNATAFSYDDEECDMQRLTGERKWDATGELAAGMQNTVRSGDIWAEGIVWPRIAEITLLGGLGTGRALVSMVIEELERMKATGKYNYDYITLQATDNSIPFYESMGFVRVGALVQDESMSKSTSSNRERSGSTSSTASTTNDDDDDDAVAEPVEEGSPEKPNAIAVKYEISTGPLSSYTIKRAGETPNEIAKKMNVDVWDILFLNRDIYKELGSGSRFLAGSVIHLPAKEKSKSDASSVQTRKAEAEMPRWYVANENDTPRFISKKFEVNCLDLIEANRARLAGLMSNSRLKEGTRVKVSHFDEQEENNKPYAHWTFPDDSFEDGEPSYMMAMKLNRCRGTAAKSCPFQESLAVPVSKYEPTSLVLPPSPVRTMQAFAPQTASSAKGNRPMMLQHPDEPKPPKRPVGPYMLFANDQRRRQCSELAGLTLGDSSKIISDRWKNLSDDSKRPFDVAAKKAMAAWLVDKEAFHLKLATFKATHQTPVAAPVSHDFAYEGSAMKVDLFNKVVRLKPGAMTEGSEFSYWFVLTFIPDLKWCHLAPMIQVGTFGSDKRKAEGRPKWKLVDESHGKEVDISSSFCIPIKSRSMKRTQDADKEEWDIIDDGSCPGKTNTGRRSSTGTQRSAYDSDSNEPDSAIRSMRNGRSTKKRKHSSPVSSTFSESPLVAIRPGSEKITYIRLSGKCLENNKGGAETGKRKGRGRPKGSKNKPKLPQVELVAVASPPPTPKRKVPPIEPDVVASPLRRSPGRSRKVQAVEPVVDAPPSTQRGRGRPRNTPSIEPDVIPSPPRRSPSRSRRTLPVEQFVDALPSIKKGRGRPRKASSIEPDVVVPPPERSPGRSGRALPVYPMFAVRGRPMKAPPTEPDGVAPPLENDLDCSKYVLPVEPNVDAPPLNKRGPGRPRKYKLPNAPPPPAQSLADDEVPQKRGRGRPKGSTRKLQAPPPGGPKRSPRLSTASPQQSTEVLATASRGPGRVKMDYPQNQRPRRSVAPVYMGESPSTPHASVPGNHGTSNSSGRSSVGFVRDASVLSNSPPRPRRFAAMSNLLTSPIQRSTSRRPPKSVDPPKSSPIRTSPVRRTKRSESESTGSTASSSAGSIKNLIARPRRSAAPSYLGESPMLGSPPPLKASKRSNAGVSPLVPQTFSVNVRPKRNAAPSFLGETPDRKRRKFSSPGSRRIVVQN